jgi:hypothetical protein
VRPCTVGATFPLLVRGRIDRGVESTTAGRFWHASSIGFRTIEERACFVLITSVGCRVVLDLASGQDLAMTADTAKLLAEEDADLTRQCAELL